MRLLITFVVLSFAVFTDGSGKMYKKVGDEVVLKPGSPAVTQPITSIVWKHEQDLAMEWYGGEIYAYRHFEKRGNLSTSTGALTITGLTREDSGLYSAEINNKHTSRTHLQVIFPVPKPAVSVSCDSKLTHCVLTCDGNTLHAEPVTYSWKADDVTLTSSSKVLNITQESNNHKNFSCKMENPVSVEESKHITILFTNRHHYVLFAVGIIFLLVVVVLVIISRCKAGKVNDVKTRQLPTGDEAAVGDDAVANTTSEQPDENSPMLTEAAPPDGVSDGQPPEDPQTTHQSGSI